MNEMLEEQEGGPLTNKIAMVVPGGKKPVECFFALWTKSNGNKIYYFISGSKNKTLRPNLIWTNVLKDEIVSISVDFRIVVVNYAAIVFMLGSF